MTEIVARNNSDLWSRILQTTRRVTAVRKTFFVIEAGRTNLAHHDFVEKLKGVGLNEAKSHEACDYLLSFCPVASRVGTDISEALNKIPAGKPTVLVVMHHTFDPDHLVAESSRLVNNPNILTVDCLFFEQRFLKCQRNDAAWVEVKKYVGVSSSQVFFWKILGHFIRQDWRNTALTCTFWGMLCLLYWGMLNKVEVDIDDFFSKIPWMMDL